MALNIVMTWFYKQKVVDELPKDCVGFVYEITNLANGRKYIGKKLAKISIGEIIKTKHTIKLLNINIFIRILSKFFV